MMTKDEVRARVDQLRIDVATHQGTDEADWHEAEDRLWRDVLQAIAMGAPDALGLANEALKTLDIEYSRWFQ